MRAALVGIPSPTASRVAFFIMPIDKTPWTDDTVMPWGEHKGTAMRDVPSEHLLWLFSQDWTETAYPGLHTYLVGRSDELIAKRNEIDPTSPLPEDSTSFDDYLRSYRGF